MVQQSFSLESSEILNKILYKKYLGDAFKKWNLGGIQKLIQKNIIMKKKDAFYTWYRWNLYNSRLLKTTRIQLYYSSKYQWGIITKVNNNTSYQVVLDNGSIIENCSRDNIIPETRLIRGGQIIDWNEGPDPKYLAKQNGTYWKSEY